MVAIKSFIAVTLGFLALSVAAIDDRLLAEIPTEAQTCKIYKAACNSYVKTLAPSSTVNVICEPGSNLGGTSAEVAVTCSYTLKGKTINVTKKVISRAGLIASA